jgi:hypothetical protein
MNITLSIPKSYEDITVKEYKDIRTIIGSEQSEQEKALGLIGMLCRADKEQLKHIKHSDMEAVLRQLNWIYNEPDTRQELIRTFEMNGKKYGFIPNMSELTIAEFADLDTYSSNGYENLEHMMAVLYRPITEWYKDFYEIERYNHIKHHHVKMQEMPMNVAMSAMVFFYNIERELVTDLGNSLETTNPPN